MLFNYAPSFFRLLLEGTDPRKLDKLGKSFGFPVGPVTLTDEVGIDIGAHIGEYLTTCFGDRFGGANPEVLTTLVNAGITGTNFTRAYRFRSYLFNLCLIFFKFFYFSGRKSGKGFFVYEKGSKGERPVCAETMDILKKFSMAPKGLTSDEDIQFRLASRFINEVISCLKFL